ncbi:MAG TPA: hypothetical protein VH592_21080 [Gemmataceae bacterium]|jgi:hypothetical protein
MLETTPSREIAKVTAYLTSRKSDRLSERKRNILRHDLLEWADAAHMLRCRDLRRPTRRHLTQFEKLLAGVFKLSAPTVTRKMANVEAFLASVNQG